MELGVTTLVAWESEDVESEDVFKGSFKEMVTRQCRHKKKLKMSFTLTSE